MAKIHLKIITPERVVFEQDIDHVMLPSTTGEIDILPGHIPLMTALSIGAVIVFKDKTEEHLAMGSGFAEIKNNTVTVLTETAEHATELDEDRAQQARDRATQIMASSDLAADQGQAAVAASLQKSLARLKVLERHRRKHGNHQAH